MRKKNLQIELRKVNFQPFNEEMEYCKYIFDPECAKSIARGGVSSLATDYCFIGRDCTLVRELR